MVERPILFSSPMIRAILEGRKTVTRRVVKMATPKAHSLHDWCVAGIRVGRCPHGQPGDRLWVRETWGQLGPFSCDDDPVFWRADYSEQEQREQLLPKWRPSIHMPRWASRIELEVTSVRVERLQDGEGEMPRESRYLAEGINHIHHGDGAYYYSALRDEPHPKNWIDPFDAWRELWQSTGGEFDDNPWVWVVEFKRVEVSHG